MGSAVSLELWDTGSIPSPAQWVGDLVLPQPCFGHSCNLDLISGPGTPCVSKRPKNPQENAPYQRINQIVLESVPPQIENAQNESEAEPAFSFANFGTIAHAYLESVISGKKPEEHYSVKEFIGLENKTEKIQEIKKICEEMKNAFENSDLGKRAKNSTKHFAELNFRSKLSSKIVKAVRKFFGIPPKKNGEWLARRVPTAPQ